MILVLWIWANARSDDFLHRVSQERNAEADDGRGQHLLAGVFGIVNSLRYWRALSRPATDPATEAVRRAIVFRYRVYVAFIVGGLLPLALISRVLYDALDGVDLPFSALATVAIAITAVGSLIYEWRRDWPAGWWLKSLTTVLIIAWLFLLLRQVLTRD